MWESTPTWWFFSCLLSLSGIIDIRQTHYSEPHPSLSYPFSIPLLRPLLFFKKKFLSQEYSKQHYNGLQPARWASLSFCAEVWGTPREWRQINLPGVQSPEKKTRQRLQLSLLQEQMLSHPGELWVGRNEIIRLYRDSKATQATLWMLSNGISDSQIDL